MACLMVSATTARGTNLQIEEVSFVSRGILLSGSIVFPVDQKPRAGVVFVHGSGKQTRNIRLAEKFAEFGIAALVYDKRGVGLSGGSYEAAQPVSEKNLTLLADDSHAALNALAAHTALENIPVGLSGISQAGWIVPLAAVKSEVVDFIVLWSAPVCKVSEEDIFSSYTSDVDGTKAPSYVEALRARRTPYIWPDFLGDDTDPAVSLAKLDIPGLWIFGAKDGSVPTDLSIRRLEELQQAGHQYEYVLFSGVGHNNMRETFAVAADWIKRSLN